ncbi:MAG: SUF system Fe-S cluster assembly protein [Bacteroidales bacterium]|nr:SUF system Fe-S cluster assembly protein [Bacteroidales bacterium]
MKDEDISLQSKVIDALKTIYDPEIPVNIYDLGLIYQIEVENANVRILMTLTTPNCPVAESLPDETKEKLKEIDGVGDVEVNITFDPAWSYDNLSEEARIELGLD